MKTSNKGRHARRAHRYAKAGETPSLNRCMARRPAVAPLLSRGLLTQSLAVVATLLAVCASAREFVESADCAGIDRATLPTTELEILLPPRRVAMTVEVARSPARHAQGLMCRKDKGAAMLFVFEDELPRSFWMFNTFIPLDIIYLDAEREAIAAMTMHPCPRPPAASNADWQTLCRQASRAYASNAPARYAIELPAGWLAQRGLPLSRAAAMRFRW